MVEGWTLFWHIMKIFQLWILLTKESLLYETISIFKIFNFLLTWLVVWNIHQLFNYYCFLQALLSTIFLKKINIFSDILRNTVKLCQITKGQLPHRPEIPKLFLDQNYQPNLTDLRPVGGVQLKKMRTLMLKSEWSTKETGTCKLLFNLPQVNSKTIIPIPAWYINKSYLRVMVREKYAICRNAYRVN